jgi:bifunctional DNA-binding transcriptional regulator/antitoxin component of YhaV-PrlF toxin-antitoxin module
MSIIRIDVDGRIRLPTEIRQQLAINGDDELALDCLHDDTVILKKINGNTRFEMWLNGEL